MYVCLQLFMPSFDDVDDQIVNAHSVLDGAESSSTVTQTVLAINQAISLLPEFTTASSPGTVTDGADGTGTGTDGTGTGTGGTGTGTGGTGTGTGGTGTGTDGSSTGTDDMDAAAIQETNEVEKICRVNIF